MTAPALDPAPSAVRSQPPTSPPKHGPTTRPASEREVGRANALVDLLEAEARWHNLPPAVTPDSSATLQAKQQAYAAFRARQIAYNGLFHPVHNGLRAECTAKRLAAWCRKTADLYRRASNAACPTELVKWTGRWADRVAEHCGRELVDLPVVRRTADAVTWFEAVADWCTCSGRPETDSGEQPCR